MTGVQTCALPILGLHGSYAANMAVSQCDVLLAVGTRFNDRITGKVETFAPEAAVIHIDIEASNVARNIPVDVAMIADAKEALTALAQRLEPLDTSVWRLEIASWQTAHPLGQASCEADALTPQTIVQTINASFEEVIVTTDVGQNQLWTTQFLALDEHKQLLTSGGLGTMGYG